MALVFDGELHWFERVSSETTIGVARSEDDCEHSGLVGRGELARRCDSDEVSCGELERDESRLTATGFDLLSSSSTVLARLAPSAKAKDVQIHLA